MISFLLAPVMSFFSIRLYQKALKSRQGYGFGFLLYLTFLFCCLLVFLCFFLFLPVAGGFVNWLIDVTPEVTITADGLTTKVAQPYSVRYPAFGTMYVIDTSKELDELTKLADQTKAAVVIGKKYVVVKKPQTVQRVYPLDQLMNKVKQSNRPIVITKALMHRIVNRIFSLVVPLAVLVLAPIFFCLEIINSACLCANWTCFEFIQSKSKGLFCCAKCPQQEFHPPKISSVGIEPTSRA